MEMSKGGCCSPRRLARNSDGMKDYFTIRGTSVTESSGCNVNNGGSGTNTVPPNTGPVIFKNIAVLENMEWLLSCEMLVDHNPRFMIQNNVMTLELKFSNEGVHCDSNVNSISEITNYKYEDSCLPTEWVHVNISLTEGNVIGQMEDQLDIDKCLLEGQLDIHIDGKCIKSWKIIPLHCESFERAYVDIEYNTYNKKNDVYRRLLLDECAEGFDVSLKTSLKAEYKFRDEDVDKYIKDRDFPNYQKWDISDRSKMLLNIFLENPSDLMKGAINYFLSYIQKTPDTSILYEERGTERCKELLFPVIEDIYQRKILFSFIDRSTKWKTCTIHNILLTILKYVDGEMNMVIIKRISNDIPNILKETISLFFENDNFLEKYLNIIGSSWGEVELSVIKIIISKGNYEKNKIISKHILKHTPDALKEMLPKLFENEVLEKYMACPEISCEEELIKHMISIENHEMNMIIVKNISNHSPALLKELLLESFQNDDALVKHLNNIGSSCKNEVLLNYIQICYVMRETFKKSYSTILEIIIVRNQCDENEIRSFIRTNNVLDIFYQVQIFEDIDKRLPKYDLSDGIIPFFRHHPGRLVAILSLIFTALDLTTDIKLTTQYFYWDSISSFNSSRTMYTTMYNSTSGFRVEQLDRNLPFYYSLFFILLTEIVGIFIAPFVITSKELDVWFGRSTGILLKLILWLFIGLLLPFLTGLYKLFVEIQGKRFNDNFIKREALRKTRAKIEEAGDRKLGLELNNVELFPDEIICNGCKEEKDNVKGRNRCNVSIEERQVGKQNDTTICIFCGYYNTVAYNVYELKTMEIKTKWSHQYGQIKLISTAIEDTYLPILQIYLFFPLVMNYFNSNLSFGISAKTFYNITVYSVLTSIINIASGLTTTFFSKNSKYALGKHILWRLVYYASSVFLICARLLFVQVFAVTYLSGRLTPVYLSLALISHCCVVFIFKCVIFCCQKGENKKACTKDAIVKMLFSSLSSSYILTKLDILENKALPTEFSNTSDTELVKMENNAEALNVSEGDAMISKSSGGSLRDARSLERILFTCLIIGEQIIMTILIFASPRLIDVRIFKILVGLWMLYVIGLLLEIMFHLFINPWAKMSNAYDRKKYVFYIFIGMLVSAALVYIVINAEDWRISILFILGVILLVAMIIICKRYCKKKAPNDPVMKYRMQQQSSSQV